MWGLIFAAMVPFHILAGALDRTGTNILFNWVVPILLVMWGAKQSTGAGDDAAGGGTSPQGDGWLTTWARLSEP